MTMLKPLQKWSNLSSANRQSSLPDDSLRDLKYGQCMSFFVAGNWKTHLLSDEVNTLTQQLLDQCNQDGVAVFPPALYVPQVSDQLRDSAIGFGVQDISEGGFGATTGDLCAQQVGDFGCQYALVGHSERRQRQQESSQWVAEKALAAVNAGLVPIVCVGETLEEREAGNDVATVMAQLEPVLNLVPVDSTLMVAYEPVWAIGTGKTASAGQAQAMHSEIRARLSQIGMQQTKILYGGSVKAANAAELALCPDVDGALVGGAALQIDEFAAIVAAFQERQ